MHARRQAQMFTRHQHARTHAHTHIHHHFGLGALKSTENSSHTECWEKRNASHA